ncbi:MAG: hypothetical protein ABSD68_03045 [Candidatus Micrarchaeales archaeon]|jgi:hypothetical protein
MFIKDKKKIDYDYMRECERNSILVKGSYGPPGTFRDFRRVFEELSEPVGIADLRTALTERDYQQHLTNGGLESASIRKFCEARTKKYTPQVLQSIAKSVIMMDLRTDDDGVRAVLEKMSPAGVADVLNTINIINIETAKKKERILDELKKKASSKDLKRKE